MTFVLLIQKLKVEGISLGNISNDRVAYGVYDVYSEPVFVVLIKWRVAHHKVKLLALLYGSYQCYIRMHSQYWGKGTYMYNKIIASILPPLLLPLVTLMTEPSHTITD